MAAYNITGPASLQRGEGLRRAAYPEPGTYTLAVEADAGLTVTIESQNQQETMMHTSTELYRGEASGAQFAVPEDSLVVYFNFSAPETVRVESVTYQNEEPPALSPWVTACSPALSPIGSRPLRQRERHPAGSLFRGRPEALSEKPGYRLGYGGL